MTTFKIFIIQFHPLSNCVFICSPPSYLYFRRDYLTVDKNHESNLFRRLFETNAISSY